MPVRSSTSGSSTKNANSPRKPFIVNGPICSPPTLCATNAVPQIKAAIKQKNAFLAGIPEAAIKQKNAFLAGIPALRRETGLPPGMVFAPETALPRAFP